MKLFGEEEEMALPASLSALTRLEQLSVSSCTLQEAPAALAALTRLELEYVALPAWPAVVQQLAGLAELDLRSVSGLGSSCRRERSRAWLECLQLLRLRSVGGCWGCWQGAEV